MPLPLKKNRSRGIAFVEKRQTTLPRSAARRVRVGGGGGRGKSEARALKGDECAEIGETDNADAGADSFCSNVDDSLPPTKKAKIGRH